MILTRTPFRIPLGGGGTDLPAFYKQHGGFVFSAAIDKYMYISINRPILDSLVRVKYSRIEIVENTAQLEHDLARAALEYYGIKDQIEIASTADVPAGTGMGSSGSYLVGLLKGLQTLTRRGSGVQELAELACHIEIDLLHKPVGKQDQYLAAYGGFTIMNIDKNGAVQVSDAAIARETVEDLQNKLLLFYTGISRSAMVILGEQSAAAEKKESDVTKSLLQIKEIGMEIKNSIQGGNLDNFGRLMDEHWRIKKTMSTKMSDPNIDRLYALAKENGSLGGKIMGAGGGGFLVFYCPGDKERKSVREAMKTNGLKEMPFRFEKEGAKTMVDFD
ncbi:MAG: D-glycero-alpha-D-manno-heptose-7-phosphate kinase [Parcubacteria group bacterium Gr01-1014_13]|nr:MAG: D-glycero-alpha-D-manno-heptose-7-phosphate kinase [Parcubacteria group bacterium Gr01-1014_13]